MKRLNPQSFFVSPSLLWRELRHALCCSCRTINAFLNTGVGGCIYCGVDDNGKVRGLNLSPYQVCTLVYMFALKCFSF